MMTNKDKIYYIERTVEEKGYYLNTFKIENIGGEVNVVWNISNQPHLVCEYFREKGLKVVSVKGMYGVTSLIFDTDCIPDGFYEFVDDLPSIKDTKKIIRKYESSNEALKQLHHTYPSLVNMVARHFEDYSDAQIIDFLIKELNFKDFVTRIGEEKYLIELVVKDTKEE